MIETLGLRRSLTQGRKWKSDWLDGCCCCCCQVASVVSDSVRPRRWQPTRLPIPGILRVRTLEWVARGQLTLVEDGLGKEGRSQNCRAMKPHHELIVFSYLCKLLDHFILNENESRRQKLA